MADRENTKCKIRPMQLLSIPGILFLLTVLLFCYLEKGPQFAVMLGVGSLVGLFAAAIAVVSNNSGSSRFTIRSLLIAITAVAMILAWHQSKVTEEEAIAAIERLGGKVDFGEMPDQSGNINKVCRVKLIRMPLRQKDLRFLRFLPGLVKLDLDYSHVGDDGLWHVGKLEDLRWLDIEDSAITDVGLEHLIRLQSVESIILDNNDITNDGLMHLRKLKSLRRVRALNTAVTQSGVTALETALPECEVTFK